MGHITCTYCTRTKTEKIWSKDFDFAFCGHYETIVFLIYSSMMQFAKCLQWLKSADRICNTFSISLKAQYTVQFCKIRHSKP